MNFLYFENAGFNSLLYFAKNSVKGIADSLFIQGDSFKI